MRNVRFCTFLRENSLHKKKQKLSQSYKVPDVDNSDVVDIQIFPFNNSHVHQQINGESADFDIDTFLSEAYQAEQVSANSQSFWKKCNSVLFHNQSLIHQL